MCKGTNTLLSNNHKVAPQRVMLPPDLLGHHMEYILMQQISQLWRMTCETFIKLCSIIKKWFKFWSIRRWKYSVFYSTCCLLTYFHVFICHNSHLCLHAKLSSDDMDFAEIWNGTSSLNCTRKFYFDQHQSNIVASEWSWTFYYLEPPKLIQLVCVVK
jgi:hypothetical protein